MCQVVCICLCFVSHAKCLLTQYKVPNSGLEKRTLCLSVWNDNFWRSKFLGQILLPLSKVDLSQRRDRWMILSDYHRK